MKYTMNLKLMMKKCAVASALGFFLYAFCGTTTATAQNTVPQQPQQQPGKTDYSDSMLKAFLDVNIKLQPLQQTAQQHIVKSIESSGITIDRFREIAQAQQEGKQQTLSAKDSTAFNKAAEQVMKEKEAVDSQMANIIQKEGMDLQTFQGIAMAYQQSPEIQEKLNKMISAKQQNVDSTAEQPASPTK